MRNRRITVCSVSKNTVFFGMQRSLCLDIPRIVNGRSRINSNVPIINGRMSVWAQLRQSKNLAMQDAW